MYLFCVLLVAIASLRDVTIFLTKAKTTASTAASAAAATTTMSRTSRCLGNGRGRTRG